MTKDDKPLSNDEVNQRLHKAFGYCVHEMVKDSSKYFSWFCCAECKYMASEPSRSPNYCANPLLVLREMRERGDFGRWVSVVNGLSINEDGYLLNDVIPIDLILDTTGKLARKALEWVERSKP